MSKRQAHKEAFEVSHSKLLEESYNQASKEIKRRIRFIRSALVSEGYSIPHLSFLHPSVRKGLAQLLVDKRKDQSLDGMVMKEFISSGRRFVDRKETIPEFFMPTEILRYLEAQSSILDSHELGSDQWRLKEQTLIEKGFEARIGLTANFNKTVRALGFASHGGGGFNPLNQLPVFAVGQAYIQIIALELGKAHDFCKAKLDVPLGRVGVGGDALDLRIFYRSAVKTTLALLNSNVSREANFYIQRIGASSAESDPFKRENKQLHLNPLTGKWESNKDTCMIFAALEPLIIGYSVRIAGVAPLGDGKNGYVLESSLCIHLKSCGLFFSMSANITMGGPHDVVPFWLKSDWVLGQSPRCRSINAVRALVNSCNIEILDNLDAEVSLEVIATVNSRLAVSVKEVVASVKDGRICGSLVGRWNGLGRGCFPKSSLHGEIIANVGTDVSTRTFLTCLGALYVLFAESLRPKSHTSFKFLSRSIPRNPEAKNPFVNELVKRMSTCKIELTTAQRLANSLFKRLPDKKAREAKKCMTRLQKTLKDEINPTSHSLPMGKTDRGLWNFFAWPTSAQGNKPTNEDGSLSPTMAMIYANTVENSSPWLTDGAKVNSILDTLEAALMSDAQVKRDGEFAKEQRETALDWVKGYFAHGPLTLDLFFAHFNDVISRCGAGPSLDSKNACIAVVKEGLITDQVRFGMRGFKVYSKDASDTLHDMFTDKSTIGKGENALNVCKIDVTDLYQAEILKLVDQEAASTRSIARLQSHVVILTGEGKAPSSFIMITYLWHPSYVFKEIGFRNFDTLGPADEYFVIFRAYEWIIQAIDDLFCGLPVTRPIDTAFGEEFKVVREGGHIDVECVEKSKFVEVLRKAWKSMVDVGEVSEKKAAGMLLGGLKSRVGDTGTYVHHLTLQRDGDTVNIVVIRVTNQLSFNINRSELSTLVKTLKIDDPRHELFQKIQEKRQWHLKLQCLEGNLTCILPDWIKSGISIVRHQTSIWSGSDKAHMTNGLCDDDIEAKQSLLSSLQQPAKLRPHALLSKKRERE